MSFLRLDRVSFPTGRAFLVLVGGIAPFVIALTIVGALLVLSVPSHGAEYGSPARTASPPVVPVRAAAAGLIPGAIVCSDYRKVQLMMQWYIDRQVDVLQDVVTGGQSKLLRGDPVPAPVPALLGCAMFPAGAMLELEQGRTVVPVVRGRLPSGVMIRGVTDPSLLQRLTQ